MQQAISLLEQTDSAATLLSPVRLKILEKLREPDSSAGVARKLGLPRQRVGYHVRELEKRGLLEHVGERRRGNLMERLVQASARHYLIAPQALGALGATPDEIHDRLSSAYLVACAGQLIREVATLQGQARAVEKKLQTFTLRTDVRFSDPAAQNGFVEELTQCFAGLMAKYHDPNATCGRSFRFFVGSHPVPAATDPSGSEMTPEEDLGSSKSDTPEVDSTAHTPSRSSP